MGFACFLKTQLSDYQAIIGCLAVWTLPLAKVSLPKSLPLLFAVGNCLSVGV